MTDKKSDDRIEEQLNRLGIGLIKHLDERFAELSSRMDRFENRMSSLEGGIDTVLKNQETDVQERLAGNRQVDRHEDWIERAAPGLVPMPRSVV